MGNGSGFQLAQKDYANSEKRLTSIVQQATLNDLILPIAHQEFIAKYNNPRLYSHVVRLEDLEDVASLGDGAFGHVTLTRDRNTHNYYAVKVMVKHMVVKMKQVEHILSEKRIQHSVSFPFLLSSTCVYKDHVNLYVVMPFVGGGELFHLLRQSKNFTEKNAQFYTSQVVLALEYLHNLSIIYRDLKPENIVIDTSGYIKIIDFGFAKHLGSSVRTWTLCGTPEYMAPEIVTSVGFGKAADWWALGVLIFEMKAGYTPFYDEESSVMYERITNGEVVYPETLSSNLKDLLKNLLQVDVIKRFGVVPDGVIRIKVHPWFKDVDWCGIYYRKVRPPFQPPEIVAGDAVSKSKISRVPSQQVDEVDEFAEEFKDF